MACGAEVELAAMDIQNAEKQSHEHTCVVIGGKLFIYFPEYLRRGEVQGSSCLYECFCNGHKERCRHPFAGYVAYDDE